MIGSIKARANTISVVKMQFSHVDYLFELRSVDSMSLLIRAIPFTFDE